MPGNPKIKVYFLKILFIITPFIPVVFQNFSSIVNFIYVFWRTGIVAYVCIKCFWMSKKKRESVITYTFVCMMVLAISTVSNSGNYFRLSGYIIDSAGLMLVIWYYYNRDGMKFIIGIQNILRLEIYINLICFLLFPQGVYNLGREDADNVRYNFLGLDNQAAQIIFLFMICIWSIDIFRNYKTTLHTRIDLLACIGSLVYLWSVTAILGLGVFFCVFLFGKIFRHKISLKVLTILVGVIGVAVVGFHAHQLVAPFIENVLHKDVQLSSRTLLWQEAITQYLQKPFLGFGIQNSDSLVYFSIYRDYRHAHNQYIQTLILGGIPYFLSWLCMLFVFEKKIDHQPNQKYIQIITAGVCGYLFMCIADSYGHLVGLYMLMIIALCLCHERQRKNRNYECCAY